MSISLLQAKTLALASVSVAPVKRVTLRDALGRFLADGVSTKQPSPISDIAAVDGYALASLDTHQARKDHPVHVRIVPTSPEVDLKPGHAMRVRMGGPVPFGADAVAGTDHASDDGQRVSLTAAVTVGTNVRRRGEEWNPGELLMPAGQRLDAAAVSLLLSLGIEDVPVRAWPRVAVFAPGEGATTDALLLMMASLLDSSPVEVVGVERCAEREEVVAGMLDRLTPRAEIVVVCPGFGSSSRELIKGVIKRVGGTWGFDGLQLKPGRHAAVAVLKGKSIAVLPGPPLAAMAGFDQLLWPMLLKRHGVVERKRRVTVKIDAPIRKRPGRTMLVPARLEPRGAELHAVFRSPPSLYLSGALDMDGWLVLPSEQGDVKPGDSLELELSSGATYSGMVTNPSDDATR